MATDVCSFSSQLPVKIAFGDGVIATLPAVLASLNAEAAFVVVEESVVGNASLEQALSGTECRIERFTKSSGEPTFQQCDELARRIRDGGFDTVVGIGGGSALDLAKAARIVADHGGTAREHSVGQPIASPSIALVLCPTTSGTGSEVSGASVLSDLEQNEKVGFGNPLMRAQHALVDPQLTHGLPPKPTAYSGIDALAQAIAGSTVTDGSPLSVAMSVEAVRHIAASIAAAVRDGSNAQARTQLACGSLMAGLAMNLSDCAADHALGQAMGSELHLPHGLTVGLVLAECLDVIRPDCAERLERVADAMGAPADGTSDGSRAVTAVRSLLRAVAFPTMAEAAVREEHVDRLTELALTEQAFFFTIDCHAWTRDDVAGAYRAALAITAR